MEIQDIMLAQDIKRWTIVRMMREQSLAEHSFNVTMIARAICKEIGLDDTNVTKYALDHDLDEILTGDIPTPAKQRLKIRDPYKGSGRALCDSQEISIVMLADMIEAIAFIQDNQIGRHANVVAEELTTRYTRRCDLISATNPKLITAANKVVLKLLDSPYETEKS